MSVVVRLSMAGDEQTGAAHAGEVAGSLVSVNVVPILEFLSLSTKCLLILSFAVKIFFRHVGSQIDCKLIYRANSTLYIYHSTLLGPVM